MQRQRSSPVGEYILFSDVPEVLIRGIAAVRHPSVESPSAFVVHRATSGTSSALWGDGEENAMAIAPEPGETKCPKCSSAMAQVGVTKEEGQTVKHLECPECGHRLKDPAGASSSPPGW